MRLSFRLCLSLLAAAVLLLAAATTAGAHEAGTSFMKVYKQAHGNKPHRTSLLYSHGGSIEQTPKVYIVYWGSDWATGFSTGGYSSSQAQNYVESFFGGVGGSSWAASTTQYCQGVPSGTTSCSASSVHPLNGAGQLVNTWTDGTSLPSSISQTAIANEASRLAQRFGGVDPNADYMVFTPTGHSESGFGTNWCAYHSSSGSLSYSYIPYQPDAGAACGQNFVNGLDNNFGNGYFDGFSIVAGHEYAETITDPFPNTGWLDSRGAENADKCAWISSGQGAASNISLGANRFAVQSLWSNAFNGGAGGCVITYP
jgi:serine protease